MIITFLQHLWLMLTPTIAKIVNGSDITKLFDVPMQTYHPIPTLAQIAIAIFYFLNVIKYIPITSEKIAYTCIHHATNVT